MVPSDRDSLQTVRRSSDFKIPSFDPYHFGSRWNHPHDPLLPRSVDTDAEQPKPTQKLEPRHLRLRLHSCRIWFYSGGVPALQIVSDRTGGVRMLVLLVLVLILFPALQIVSDRTGGVRTLATRLVVLALVPALQIVSVRTGGVRMPAPFRLQCAWPACLTSACIFLEVDRTLEWSAPPAAEPSAVKYAARCSLESVARPSMLRRSMFVILDIISRGIPGGTHRSSCSMVLAGSLAQLPPVGRTVSRPPDRVGSNWRGPDACGSSRGSCLAELWWMQSFA